MDTVNLWLLNKQNSNSAFIKFHDAFIAFLGWQTLTLAEGKDDVVQHQPCLLRWPAAASGPLWRSAWLSLCAWRSPNEPAQPAGAAHHSREVSPETRGTRSVRVLVHLYVTSKRKEFPLLFTSLMMFLNTNLISDWSFHLFPLIPNIRNCCHEVSSVVHGDRTQQLQDLLPEVLYNRCKQGS